MFKYPRTRHICGSRLQKGDDLEDVPLEALLDRHLVIEEKMDGANAGISFEDGEMRLQSRGHFLRGGPRERHFDLFKQWAACHQEALYCALEERYVMYGEWMFAKHTCFYDKLPHYFMEFDLYDKERDTWASTKARAAHYAEAGVSHIVQPVLVISEGKGWKLEALKALVTQSNFKTNDWPQFLRRAALAAGENFEHVRQHTDPHSEMEGLYIKWEEGDLCLGRYKFVRESFTNSIMEQDTHWLKRTIVPNVLAAGAQERMFEQ
jgi:hypothetical protein